MRSIANLGLMSLLVSGLIVPAGAVAAPAQTNTVVPEPEPAAESRQVRRARERHEAKALRRHYPHHPRG